MTTHHAVASPFAAEARRSLRILILGAGAVTRLFYAPAFLRGLEGLRLVGVVDLSQQALDQLGPLPTQARRMRLAADQALTDPVVLASADIALVALPHALHEATVLAALRGGLHVFSEKPLGLSQAEVSRMVDAAHAAGRLLGVCQPRRSLPAVRAIAQLLGSGSLGAVRSVRWHEGQPYCWPAQSLAQVSLALGGSELHDIGAHALDVLCQWFGPLDVTDYADDSAGGTPAEFKFVLANARVGRVEVHLSRLRHLANEVVVTGERGRLVWHLGRPDAFVLEEHDGLGLPVAELKVPSEGQPLSIHAAVQAQLVSFGQAVAGLAPLQNDGDSVLGYTRIFDQCAARMSPIPRPVHADAGPAEFVVVGAAGFIGCALVEELLRQGRRVTALVHRPASAVRLLRQDIKVALCDVSNPDSYREHIAPGSVLVNCAVAHDGDELDRVVVSGALALLDAAAAKGAHRVVLLSSMLAYGDPPSSGVVDESTATTASQMPYARAKAEMERRCQQWARSHATQVVILQPTCVYGPYAKDFGTAALEEMRSGRFFLHESGQGMANLVYVGNLVDAILLAASRPVASGSRYIVNEDGEVTCWADFYGRLSEAAFGVPITTYPSISLKELEMICARWRRQHQFPNVLREAIRASPAAVDWLVAQGWFKAWRAWRGRGRENAAATTHTPAIDTDSAALPAQDAAAADASARKALHERLLAQRRLFVDESTGRFFSTRSVYSSQRIRSELGWVPRIAREKALAFTETWAADTYAHRPLMRHLP